MQALLAGLLLGICVDHAPAATIAPGNVTLSLGPTFFVDDAVVGGGDVNIAQPTVASYNRSFAGLLHTNQGRSRVTLTGFGFATATAAADNTATSLTVTFTYLGADEAVGGGDDVVMGSATGTYAYVSNGEYVFAFDTPITADLDITGTRFRIQVAPSNDTNNGRVRFKTGPLTYENGSGAKFSVAGIVAPHRKNLAKYQAVTTSSVNGPRLVSYVTDGVAGNDNSWHSSGDAPHWAQVTFPFPVEVGSAQVFSGENDGTAMTSYKLQYLENAIWVDVPGTSVSNNTNVENNLVFTTPVTSSAFRIFNSVDEIIRIRELALYPPDGGNAYPIGTDLTLNLALQRPAVASSNTAGNFALFAVDGLANHESKWQTSSAGTQSLEIDLRVNTKIGSAHLYTGSPGVAPLADFVLRYWDGSAWQDIPGGSVAGNTAADLVVPFSGGVITNRVLLEFTNPGITSVREICIFPANDANLGYPLGTNVIGAGPIPAEYEDYNDAFYNIIHTSANRHIAVIDGVPALSHTSQTTTAGEYQILLNLDTGTYRLRNRATGHCLSGAGLSTAPGEPLTDEPYTALPHQDWILHPAGGLDFVLINQWSGLAIDTQGGNTAAGTPLVQNTHTRAASQLWQADFSTHFPKKGVGGTSFADEFNVNWTYNWGQQNNRNIPDDVIYHPMQWGNFNWLLGATSGPLWQNYPNWRTTAEGIHLMGFNEPDKSGQANFSVETGITLWPRLQSLNQPLVSPAPANMNGGWLGPFYTEATNRGYRVDYTAIHTYPGPGGGSSDGLFNTIQNAYNAWGRPVWLTEFSFVDWNGNATWTEEDNYNCMAEFLWRAESVPWFRKYALFRFQDADNAPAPAQPWSPVGPRSNAHDIHGKLTPFGELYAAWDSDANVRTNKEYYVHNRGTRKRLANTLTSTANARTIRTHDTSVRWTLVPTPTPHRYYITSTRDGRRLSYVNNGAVSLVAANTTGAAVEWSLTHDQHGWHYVGHPATTQRLQLAYNNSTGVATYTMVAGNSTGNSRLWRFIVPLAQSAWSGATDTSWTNDGNWTSGAIPSTTSGVNFDETSTANLDTVLNQNFSIQGITVTHPAGPVSIGGTHSLTLGGGIDLTGASQNLALTAPVVLGGGQSWIVGVNRILSIGGAVSGNHNLTIFGAGKVSMAADHLLPHGMDAGNLIVNGLLDLNGTSQSLNGLSGDGIVDNTSATTSILTVGNRNAAMTLSALLQNTHGPLALVKTGSGSLTLPGAQDFSGGFTNDGTGNVHPRDDTAFGTGPVVMNGGQLYATTGFHAFANALTLNGAILRVGGSNNRTLTWTGPVDITADSGINADGGTGGITLAGGLHMHPGNHTLSAFANGTSHTISGPISGESGTITVANGTLHLNAANPFGGTFRPALGILRTGDPLAMQNATLDLDAADAGTVNFNNLDVTLGALTGSRNLGLGNGTIAIGNNHTSTTYSGALGGNGSLVKIGNGTLTLAGSNNHAGPTQVNGGTLALGANHTLPENPLGIGHATLDADTFSNAFGPLGITGSATIHLGAGAALQFADSSASNWAGGSLHITGTFVSGVSLRFGTHAAGLTATQLGLISAPGVSGFALNAQGFLTGVIANDYDSWKSQITNGLDARNDDADGDGFTNLQEFLFGTSPIEATGSLTSITSTGENITLRWLQRESGATYTLKQSPTLAADSWTTVVSPVPAIDGDPSGAPADYDFYKVTLPTDGGKMFFAIEALENGSSPLSPE